mmetsp:Transcript_104991/g.295703  ORF Transcript_104991/g.295703 Transcript_104991/m.295703 type:complete len:234 (-) Transcript_104991:207-908(-)
MKGFSRQVTTTDTDCGFSDGGFSRICTEDICPKTVGPSTNLISKPRPIELVLASDPTCVRTMVTDFEDTVADSKRFISEATGVPLDRIDLLLESSGRLLADYELIPSPVIVRGPDRFPKGSMLLGRNQFMHLLLELQVFFEDVAGGQKMPCAGSLQDQQHVAEQLVSRAHKQMDLQPRFHDAADMAAFYCSSNFSTDVEFQAIFREMNELFGHPQDLLFEFMGNIEHQGLIGA